MSTGDTLHALGIVRWRLRAGVDSRAPVAEAGTVTPATPDAAPPVPGMGGPAEPAPAYGSEADLTRLARQVAACERCTLAATRTQTVFGVGAPGARWMVIGEAPGAEEDRRGEPFVGRAGQLLNAMFAGIGVAREDVYIANILKCRPPDNRDPRPEEVAACRDHLRAQMRLVGPQLLLAVGRIAAQNLLGTSASLGRLRGEVHRPPELDLPVVVTYHPAYLLRTPRDKAKAWADLRLAAATVQANR